MTSPLPSQRGYRDLPWLLIWSVAAVIELVGAVWGWVNDENG